MIRGLFGPGVAVAGLDIAEADAPLFPSEVEAMARAVPGRVREFTAGRMAARAAMNALGIAPQPVPMAPDRAPVWPEGVTGSLSHAGGFCAAVLTCTPGIRAMGLDLEEDAPLGEELWGEVLVPSERAWLDGLPRPEQGRMARLLFSAKECAYKCQYPLSGILVDFTAFRIEVDPARKIFSATFQRTIASFAVGMAFSGQYACGHGLIATGIELS